MFLKSHHWTVSPFTAYERRRELRVRESRHTAMLFDKKYFDVDTCKFNRDKMPKINSYSLGELFDNSHYQSGLDIKLKYYNEPYFTPKDDNFDEECRIDEELKKLEEKVLQHKHELMEIEKGKIKIAYVMKNSWNPK